MGTITRGAKAGGGTGYNSGQTIDPTEVNTDVNTVYTEINGELDDANVKTAEMPGAKSFRFTEISAPGSPAADDVLLYLVDRSTTSTLEYKDSAGLVVSLGRLGARVYNSANISIPDTTLTALTFDTERFDRGGFHSTSSNTGRLTAPIAGTYLIIGHVELEAAADYLVVQARIRLNAGNILGNVTSTSNASLSTAMHLTPAAIYSLAAADYVELSVYQDNVANAARNVTTAAAYSPEFSIYLLGA